MLFGWRVKMNPANFIIHRIEGYISSIFLLEYEHGFLLLDSGSASDVKRIEEFCYKKLGRSPEDIKLIVVSHMHPDHSGGAAYLRKKYKIPVAAHSEVDLWYSGLGGFVQHKLDCSMAHFVAWRSKIKLERILFHRIIKPDYLLNDLEELPFFNDWKVLHVPGHTLHDIALFNPLEKLLYTADCILNIRGKLLLPLPILFPAKMQTSYDKLASLNVSTILLAHGKSLITNEPDHIFKGMKKLLHLPANNITKRAQLLSIYSPEISKEKNKQNNYL